MCGICGAVSISGGPVPPEMVRCMNSVLYHRGPDDEGYYSHESVALGHRRLSIIDLSTGHQPLSNEGGNIWIVFNGEIYNFQTLRKRLEGLGHRFSTKSDTEVIVHCYEQYGEECVKHLRGMFAFALWDGRCKKLMLARDRLGQKPLFYTEVSGLFLFASEIQALSQVPSFTPEVDRKAIDQYLSYRYIPAPHTAFKGVKKLPPACYLTLQSGRVKVERYWELQYTPKSRISEEDACEGLLEILKESVGIRMISDVPVGAFLSGGIDSSAIVALMSELSDKPVKTFSIGFQDAAYNELGFARLIAQRFNTDHHEFIVRPDVLKILPKLVKHYGEPYADCSAVPTFQVSYETRQHVTVALTGDGADESFAGYERYFANRAALLYEKIPAIIRHKLIERGVSSIPGVAEARSINQRIKRFFRSAGMPVEDRYLAWIGLFNADQRRCLYSPEFLAEVDTTASVAWFEHLFSQADGLDILDATMYVDVNSYLPYDILVKVDIASMAHSLEARSPFLDHKLMEFAARLPPDYKLLRKTHKHVLKKAMRPLLPQEILRRSKKGFGVPVDSWFRTELKPLLYEIILSQRAFRRTYFRPEVLQKMVQEHVTGQRSHGERLWALLMLEMWHREFMDTS